MQDPPKNITIKVYWHILQMLSLTQTSSYYESIQETMAVLNSDFIGSDFQFIIEYISHTPQTLILDIDVLESIKSEERVGKATLLNIYSGDLANSVLGHSTFPQDYKLAPFKDGVLIANKALARSKSTQYIGRTLTHEVGHWLGLYHTFSEGCSFPNDFVSDTRPQAQETSGYFLRKYHSISF